MPNYILSRTSPPAHIYERKINLGYGIKVDVSDAPNQTQKGKEMNNAKEVLDVADKPVAPATFADESRLVKYDGSPLDADTTDEPHPAEKAAPPEGESNDGLAFNGV